MPNIPANKSKSYIYWSLGFLALGAILDIFCFDGALDGFCRGSFFIGTFLCLLFFGLPGFLIDRFVPERIKSVWLAVPACLFFYFAWVIMMAAITEGQYRPGLIVVMGVVVIYRASTKTKAQQDLAAS